MIQSASSTWSTTDSCISSSSRRTSHFRSRPSGTREWCLPTRLPVSGSRSVPALGRREAERRRRTLVAFRLEIEGGPIHRPLALVPDRERTKVVMDGQYRVTLAPRGEVAAEKPVVLTFSLARADGSPVRDPEPLMAAGGHGVVNRQDAQTFVHVHPTREVDPSWRGGPDVAF